MIIELLKKRLLQAIPFSGALCIKICSFLELQLFITILALPILISWGLPISLLSPLGNLIFTPWLTAFLTLSSLIFFMQIISLENRGVIYLLEKLNQLFFWILDFADKSYMVSCPCPGKFFLFLIPISLFLIIKCRKSTNVYIRVLTLFVFSSCLFFFLNYILAPQHIFEYLPNKTKNILLVKHTAHKILIDRGALADGRNAPSWARYQLVPELLKRGVNTIDCLVIPFPSNKALEAIIEILKNITVNHIYLSEWHGKIPYSGWKCWKALLELKNKKEIRVTLVKKALTIEHGKNVILTITPTKNLIRKGSLKYQEQAITLNLSQKVIDIP